MVKVKGKGVKRRRARARGPQMALSNERRLLNLVLDPCEAELANGYALTTTGIVQRFNRFLTPVATTETAFAYIWNPSSQNSSAITQKLAVGTGAPTNFTTGGPGEAFLEANADIVAPLAGCIEVLYTGTLVNRKGYIGVCQANIAVLQDVASGTTDLATLLGFCQAVVPVPSSKIELKWSPSQKNYTAANAASEVSGGIGLDNALMVIAIGVNPTDFVVKFTGVYEYTPKFTLGQPAARVTRPIPAGVGERIISALDSMGHWWHNLGNAAAAANRMGYAASYGVGQMARLVSTGRRLLEPAAATLALVG